MQKEEKAYKKQKRLRIIEKVRRKSRADCATFIHNAQISRLPMLRKEPLKRFREEDTLLEDARSFNEVFIVEDLASLILTHLGPMEFVVFSRVSKATRNVTLGSFRTWAKSMVARIEDGNDIASHPENARKSYEDLRDHLSSIFVSFPVNTETFPFLCKSVRLFFRTYRAYGELKFLNECINSDPQYCFVYNERDKELVHLNETNVFWCVNYCKVLSTVEQRFEKKHGFIPSEPYMETPHCEVITECFRYDDYNKLNISAFTKDMTKKLDWTEKLLFFKGNGPDKIVSSSYDPFCVIYILQPPHLHYWQSIFPWGDYIPFFDLYECRLAVMSNRFDTTLEFTKGDLLCTHLAIMYPEKYPPV